MNWHEHSDSSLVDYAENHRQHQGPAAMEMQRRLLDAIREFNAASSRQATTMIRLSRAMTTRTVALLIVGAIQLWAMVKPNPAAASASSSNNAQATVALRPGSSDDLGWIIESYQQGLMTVRHQGRTYKATCNVSRSFSSGQSAVSAGVTEFSTCDLPVDLVGRVVQPFLGQQRDAAGRIISMWNVGSILAIQQSRSDNTPTRIDEFVITSVTGSR